MTIHQRVELGTDANGLPSFQTMTDNKSLYNFGDKVGLMVFRGWYPCISDPEHFANSQANDFPVRIGFVDDPFNLDNIINHGATDCWNLDNWIACARQLEEDGCKALVGGCGLTAMMQTALTEAVDIPVYTSTVMFIPLLQRTLKPGKKVAVLTVNENSLNMNNGVLFEECGISPSDIVIRGMDQSDHAADWAIQFNEVDYDKQRVEHAIVSVAQKLVSEHPEVGHIVLECTEMPPFANAVAEATGLPVFDAVQMTRLVHQQVR